MRAGFPNPYHLRYAVDIDGDYAIAGAPRVFAAPSFTGTGAAYIFERDEGGTNAWGEKVKLVPSAHEMKAPTPATNGVQQLVDAKKQGNIAPAPPAAGAPAAGAAATAMATASLVATTAVKQPAVSEEKKAQVEVKKPEEQKKE